MAEENCSLWHDTVLQMQNAHVKPPGFDSGDEGLEDSNVQSLAWTFYWRCMLCGP